MRKCPKCSRQYDDPVRICRTCGSFLEIADDDGAPVEGDSAQPPVEEEIPIVLTPVTEEKAEPVESVEILPDADEPRPRRSKRSWHCAQCQQAVPSTFDVCWNCGTSRSGIPDPDFVRVPLESAGHETEEVRAADEVYEAEQIHEAEEVPVMRRTTRRHGLQCAKCGSAKIIPQARILDQGPHGTRDLQVVVYGDPQALVFKDRLYGKLTADICGACGHVELRVENPAELFDHYRHLGE